MSSKRTGCCKKFAYRERIWERRKAQMVELQRCALDRETRQEKTTTAGGGTQAKPRVKAETAVPTSWEIIADDTLVRGSQTFHTGRVSHEFARKRGG